MPTIDVPQVSLPCRSLAFSATKFAPDFCRLYRINIPYVASANKTSRDGKWIGLLLVATEAGSHDGEGQIVV